MTDYELQIQGWLAGRRESLPFLSSLRRNFYLSGRYISSAGVITGITTGWRPRTLFHPFVVYTFVYINTRISAVFTRAIFSRPFSFYRDAFTRIYPRRFSFVDAGCDDRKKDPSTAESSFNPPLVASLYKESWESRKIENREWNL